jgi:chemotaxis protein methyltransferase CheR
MTEAEFDLLRAFLRARSGLALAPEKRYLVESRLSPICRRLNLGSLGELIARVKAGKDAATEKLVIEAMTTNETFFFRDRVPFDLFQKVLLPRYIAARSGARKLRIWCAASSTGQEPYSLAMILSEMGAQLAGWRVEIIGTDICTEVLEKAKAGLYTQFEVQRGLPIQMVLKYFTQVGDLWQIAPSIRAMVDYRPLNLIKDFGHLGTFDVIFCRNVLIYFDGPTKGDVFKRLAATLAPDGAVVLGAAETVIGLSDALVPDPEHRGLYVPSRAAPAAAAAAAPAAPLRLVASR